MGNRRAISIDIGRNASKLLGMPPRRLPEIRNAGLNDSSRTEGIGLSFVAVSALHPLVPLLGLDAEGCDGPGFEAANADRFVRLFAKTVGAVV